MTQSKEAHHFYPVLFYFRFDDAYHSVSRSALVALDTVSLIRSALMTEPASGSRNPEQSLNSGRPQ